MALDCYTKYQFRFAIHARVLPLNIIEDYVYLNEAVFNYGSGWFSSEEPSLGTTLGRLPFLVLSIVGSVWLILWLADESHRVTRCGIMVLWAGCLGNLLDIAIYGNVCVWLALTIPSSDVSYVVNLADVLIYAGMTTIALTWDRVWGRKIHTIFINLFLVILFRGLF